jgi:hypothetical protein
MTRRAKIISLSAAGLGALLLVVIVGVLTVAQTGWFREYVRGRIIAATE